MTNERKAPKDWKTWADFANCYSDTLDLHILPIYHYGTSWNCVSLNKVEK